MATADYVVTTRTPSVTIRRLTVEVDGEASEYFTAHIGPEMVGMVEAKPQEPVTGKALSKVATFRRLFVAEKWRRHKVGTKLIQAVDGWARSKGLIRMTCAVRTTNLPAIEFYYRNGFEKKTLSALNHEMLKRW